MAYSEAVLPVEHSLGAWLAVLRAGQKSASEKRCNPFGPCCSEERKRRNGPATRLRRSDMKLAHHRPLTLFSRRDSISHEWGSVVLLSSMLFLSFFRFILLNNYGVPCNRS